MMHLRLLIGALTMTTFIAQVEAQATQDFSCNALAGLTPVSSHYVQQVLQRADDGIAYARAGGTADDFAAILPDWALSIGSAWAGLIDTTVQRVQEADELRDASSCLHFDLALIDCKIEEVRQELRSQVSRGSFIAINRLTSLLEFLNERRRALAIGALNPEFRDTEWGDTYAFDEPATVWCGGMSDEMTCEQAADENECTSNSGTPYKTLQNCIDAGFVPPQNAPADTGQMCPFDADYAPAFDSGFGCDIDLLDPRRNYPPVQSEYDALLEIQLKLRTYRQAAIELLQLQQQIDALYGTKSSVPPPPPDRVHVEAFGCTYNGGYCDDDSDKECAKDSDCEENIECIFPSKVCDKNRAIRCKDDDQCTTIPGDTCIDGSEPQLRAVRGTFSIDDDQLAILSSFLNIRSLQDAGRQLKMDLRKASDLPEDDPDARISRAQEERYPLTQMFRGALRTAVNIWSSIQSRLEIISYPEAVDAPLEVTSALANLHGSVGEFSRLAAQKQGVRDFVIRYGAFLQRSCVTRLCGMMLKQAISIATTDECFPYANGEYLSDDENNPRWEKCKNAAKIQ